MTATIPATARPIVAIYPCARKVGLGHAITADTEEQALRMARFVWPEATAFDVCYCVEWTSRYGSYFRRSDGSGRDHKISIANGPGSGARDRAYYVTYDGRVGKFSEGWMMDGKGNTGAAREVWAIGDRVRYVVRVVGGGWVEGRVATPRREPNAAETEYVWVDWDDGESSFCDPNALDAI